MTQPEPSAAIAPRREWLAEHTGIAVVAVMVAAAALRLATAAGTWLNPDEALHYLIANQTGPLTAYRVSLGNAHPPLYFLLLWGWRLLGSSELALRLSSVLAGTLALWPLYRWLERLCSRGAALAGMTLFAFLPQTVALSAEVRCYAVMFLTMAACLNFLEKALAGHRRRDFGLAALFLYLAILTHYSALWFTLALAAYGLVRILPDRTSARRLRAWFATQAGAGLLYLWLYFTHISKLKGSSIAQEATSGWLQGLYFQPGQSSLLLFPVRSTVAVFHYLFASPAAGFLMLAVFASGVVVTAVARQESGARGGWRKALLLVLPFALACAGAAAGLFPYGGTRHTIFLGLFAVAGAGAAVGFAARTRAWLGLSIAALLAVFVNLAAKPPGQSISRQDQRRSLIVKALGVLREQVPAGDTVFADYQSSVLLGYYLGAARAPQYGRPREGFLEFDYGGYKLLVAPQWSLTPESFRVARESLAAAYDFAPGRIMWVFDAGWGQPLADRSGEFGRNIALLPVKVGLLNRVVADSLFAQAVGRIRSGRAFRARTALWPTRLRPGAERIAAAVAEEVVAYEEIYARARTDPAAFDASLPALAFWVFDDADPHPEFLGHMNDGESYVSAGYRFTLLVADPSRLIAVYLIQPDQEE